MKQVWIWGAAGIALLVLLYLILRGEPATEPEAEPVAEPAPVEASAVPVTSPSTDSGRVEPELEEAPTVEVPVEPPPVLPELDNSDPEISTALTDAYGADPVAQLLVGSQLVRKIVVTIDNLPREKISMRLRAVRSAPGRFEPGGTIDGPMLTEANFGRYAPYVALVNASDAAGTVALYQYYYPLLQEAYEELGYPDSRFNDRVVEVIDDLLAAPEIDRPVRLVRPHVLYTFEDPNLEALSAGQKMMIRMGPANAAVIKARLREVRDRVAAWEPPDSAPVAEDAVVEEAPAGNE
jgi:hypothetical protein